VSVTLDANVLVYAIDATAGRRHEQASAIVERWLLCQEGVVILQTMAEFYAVATRKLGTPPTVARSFLEGLRAVLAVHVVDERDLDRVMLTEGEHGLSFWDALLWATCDRVGIRYLLTEDFQDRRVIGRVTYLNPFLPANDGLLKLALAGSTGSSGPA
jgi:predicted nucleic acid-binding protein